MKHRFDILLLAVVGFAAVFAVLAPGSAAAAGREQKARPKAHAAIIGGSVAPAGAWPSTVYIQALTDPDPVAPTGFACTGTVVAPDVVLTAGHCAVDETTRTTVPAAEYTVVAGTQDIGNVTPDELFSVSQVIPDPAFRTSTSAPPVNDAAVLILSSPVSVPSMPLASAGDAGLEAAGTPTSITGWGLTRTFRAGTVSTEIPPTQLQQATTAVVSDATCDAAYNIGSAQYVSPSMLCTQARAAGTCNGDSGGPLLARRADGTWVEVGLTSWGIDGCSLRFPSVFTRVSELSAWVSQEIALNPSVRTAAPTDGGGGTTTGETPPPSTTDTTTEPSPPPASTPPPLAPTPLPPPPVASPVVKTLAAGLFRGTTGQRRSIALRVAGAGAAAAKKLSELRFGYRFTCRRPAAHASATLAPVSSAHRWAIAVGHGKLGTFDKRVRSGADVLRVTGTFTNTKRAHGTLRVTRRAGGCDTGVVHWSASLR